MSQETQEGSHEVTKMVDNSTSPKNHESTECLEDAEVIPCTQDTYSNCDSVHLNSNQRDILTRSNISNKSDNPKDGSTSLSILISATNKPSTQTNQIEFPTETPEPTSTQYLGFTPQLNAQDKSPWECPICHTWEFDSMQQCMVCSYENYRDEEENVRNNGEAFGEEDEEETPKSSVQWNDIVE
jgi:hypothetical protein